MPDKPELSVIVETEEFEEVVEIKGQRSSTDIGGGFGLPGAVEAVKKLTKRKRVSLDAQALKAQMENMVSIVNDLFSQADRQTGLRLEEVELSVEIGVEGQVSIVGNGGSLGNAGGITLRFTRSQ